MTARRRRSRPARGTAGPTRRSKLRCRSQMRARWNRPRSEPARPAETRPGPWQFSMAKGRARLSVKAEARELESTKLLRGRGVSTKNEKDGSSG